MQEYLQNKMEIKNIQEVEVKDVEMEGAKNVKMQVLTEGAGNFTMRRFILGTDGQTPLHNHDWEHEAFILAGKGTFNYKGKENQVEKGTVIYVEANTDHQFKNIGEEDFEFLCLIPSEKRCMEK